MGPRIPESPEMALFLIFFFFRCVCQGKALVAPSPGTGSYDGVEVADKSESFRQYWLRLRAAALIRYAFAPHIHAPCACLTH